MRYDKGVFANPLPFNNPYFGEVLAMSLEKSRARRERINVYLGFFLVFVLVLSGLAPLFTSNIQAPTIEPTATPAPVRPTPISDLGSITFDSLHRHRSGVFSVNVPSGWDTVADTNNATEVQTSMRNQNAQSVVDARVIAPLTPVETVEDVDAFFNSEWLSSSWRDYTSWQEVGRKTEGERVTIDFTLRRGLQDFIARQVSYTDGEWVYSVRVIVPPDGNVMGQHLLDNVLNSFKANNALYGVAFDWSGFVDSNNGVLVRFPANWQVTDSGLNAPTSLSGDNLQMRVERVEAQVSGGDEAAAFLAGTYPQASVTNVEESNNFGTVGYIVTANIPNVHGDLETLFALVLPADEGAIFASVRVPQADVPLDAYPNLRGILSEVSLLPSS